MPKLHEFLSPLKVFDDDKELSNEFFPSFTDVSELK